MTPQLEWLKTKKNVDKHSVLGDFGHLMEMLWIPLISQIGRNHQNMWKKSVFLKVPDNVWTCFEITSWQKSSKKTKKRIKLWKKRVFSPMLFCPGDIFMFVSIYLPAITCSHFKLRPSPTYWPPVCQPIYLYVNIYIYVCKYIYIYVFIYFYIHICTCNHLQSF